MARERAGGGEAQWEMQVKVVFFARGGHKLVDRLRLDEEVGVASSYYIDDGLAKLLVVPQPNVKLVNLKYRRVLEKKNKAEYVTYELNVNLLYSCPPLPSTK